jgi:hypothetical protein
MPKTLHRFQNRTAVAMSSGPKVGALGNTSGIVVAQCGLYGEDELASIYIERIEDWNQKTITTSGTHSVHVTKMLSLLEEVQQFPWGQGEEVQHHPLLSDMRQ